MKVLHVVYSDYRGGAAIGANRLHRGMITRGVNSEMLVLDKVTTDNTVHELLKKLDGRQHVAAHRFAGSLKMVYGVPDLPIRTFNIGGVMTSSVINSLNPDIVQMHWIGNNMVRLDDMRNIKAPIVWKMADMWAFSGGEHYSNADEPQRHRLGYDQVPPFRGETNDVDRMIWELKRIHFADLNLTMVSPSRFMASESHQSALLREYDAHVIPNPLPRRYFRSPQDEQARIAELRNEFGLPQDKMLVTFSAFLGGEKRKGYDYIEKMLANHLRNHLSPQDVECMIIGGDLDYQAEHFGYTVHFRKHMPNNQRYSNLLFASDVLLFPSEMDNSAMVIQEFIAARRPAVVFAVGGNVDMVHHKKSGYLAPPYDIEELARGLKWYHSEADKEAVRRYCGQRAIALHDPLMTVEGYLRLYEKILRNTRRGLPTRSGRFYDREVDNSRAARPARRIAIVDPSVKDIVDSSHNTKCALAFHAYFRAAGFTPTILANERCRVGSENIDVRPVFDYTAYDKLRATKDTRDGEETASTILDHTHYSRRGYRRMAEFLRTAGYTRRDAVFFPMADRILIDAVLRYLTAEDSVDGPSFHFNLMFEKAEFLVGNYPIGGMLRALAASRYVGRRIFFYSETQAMATQLSKLSKLNVTVLRPPALVEPDQIPADLDKDGVLAKAMADALVAWTVEDPTKQPQEPAAAATAAGEDGAKDESFEPAAPEGGADQAVPAEPESEEGVAEPAVLKRESLPAKQPGEFWIVAPGRGRRDKGWARLPNIAGALGLFDKTRSTKVIAQQPRAMDNLGAAADSFADLPGTILLDEIISNDELAELTEQADMFLLPYDKNVYGVRGSAFVWEAVVGRKPMVVSAQTALAESIIHGNGIACTDDFSFLMGIGKIVENYEEYRQNAEKAYRYYVSLSSTNPVTRYCQKEDYFYSRTILVFTNRPFAENIAIPGLTPLDKVVQIHIRQSEPLQKGLFQHPAPGQNFIAAYQGLCDPKKESVVLAPEVIEGLQYGFFSRVLMRKGMPGSQLLVERIERYGYPGSRIEMI